LAGSESGAVWGAVQEEGYTPAVPWGCQGVL